ncbi:MAG: hypothetical protein ACJ8FY_18830 [Gemmataceae bacterium]
MTFRNTLLEEFTSDLTDLMNIDQVSHLSSHGLAKVGTEVLPGMLLIGKIGRKKVRAGIRDMNKVELLIASPDERRNYFKERAYDASVYAPGNCYGKVAAAYFEVDGKLQRFAQYETPHGVAVIEIEALAPRR